MDHISDFQLARDDQSDSILFTLPGEVRDKIFTFTLNCFENLAKQWDKNSSWVRPEYGAPLIADTALLQTCQRIYTENCKCLSSPVGLVNCRGAPIVALPPITKC